jgi:hypothetical protein
MSTLPTDDALRYVLSSPDKFAASALLPFDDKVRRFLALLSEHLVADEQTRSMPDVMAFAWWCRRANIERLTGRYNDGILRIGRGLAFHVTPANVPVNFAFSWAFSLLAGNANIVRLPTRDFLQIPYLLRHISETIEDKLFAEIRSMNVFVTYGHEEIITQRFSAIADVRILWGGDAAIQTIRKAPTPARSVDVCFADRYSFCVLGASQVLRLDDDELRRLAVRFFNDAFLLDQNACSSPRLVVWLGDEPDASRAGERFWAALHTQVEGRYELAPISSVDKFTQSCRDAIELDCVTKVQGGDNRIYRLRLDSLTGDISDRRCACGYFYEYTTNNMGDLAPIITSAYQTLTYFGVTTEELSSFVRKNRIPGIDRIVPVGEAMDIGLVWDGYDLIHTLSRICEIH